MRQLAYLILILTGCLLLACVLFYDATQSIDASIQREAERLNHEINN